MEELLDKIYKYNTSSGSVEYKNDTLIIYNGGGYHCTYLKKEDILSLAEYLNTNT